MRKNACLFLACLLVILLPLCACQASPEKAVVVSKGDRAFDRNAIISAEETHAPDATQAAKYTDTFMSTDGSVTFQVSIDESLMAADMPVVEAAPHILTSEDAKRAAESLFGDAPCFDRGHVLNPIYSKSQIQDRLNLWSQYMNDEEALKRIFGEITPDQLDSAKATLDRAITDYTRRYETAPEESPYPLTDWEYKNSDYYLATEEDIAKNGVQGDCDEIYLIIPTGEVNYIFNAAIRDNETSKLSYISVWLSRGISPCDIEQKIYHAALCGTQPPTEAQIDAVKEKALSILKKMGLGEWCISETFAGHPKYGNDRQYVINVSAVPQISGIPAGVMDADIAPQSSAYAFSYYESLAQFEFSADGAVVRFELKSPIDVIREVNDNVAVMDMDSLMARAKEQLSLCDYRAFGGGVLADALADKEKIACTVTIDQLDYRLLRVPVRDSPMTFYYAPSITLSGTVEYTGEDSGAVYQSFECPLLSLNAVDGTVIRS